MTEKSDFYWQVTSSDPQDKSAPSQSEAVPADYQDYLRAASDWIWEVDDNLNYTFISKGIVKILGVPVETLLGSYIFSLAYFKQVNDGLLAIVEALQDRLPFRNHRVILEDTRGVERVLSLSGVPIFDRADGSFIGYRGTGADVTEAVLSAAEDEAKGERFRDFAEISADWLWESDVKHRVTFLTKDYEERSGLLAKNSLGHSFLEIWGLNEVVGPQVHAHQAFRMAVSAWHHAGRDESRDFIFTARPSFDPRGTFQGYRGVAVDFTGQIGGRGDLLEAKQSAEQASLAKSEYLSNLSHELRTPLNAIIGFSDAMRNEVMGALENESYLQYAEDIHNSAGHVLELVNGILDLSKIEAGKMELSEDEVDIPAIIEECLRFVRDQAEKTNIKLVTECDDNLPLLRADQLKIKQILLNLLSNALKYTPEDGQVMVVARLTNSGAMEIEVRDTGIGIESEEIPKVLARFGQAEAAKGREGTGLGLTITKSLAELHGGALRIVSGEGVGTRVVVQLPKERVMSGEIDEAEPWKILF